jgi:hypothetical protein
VNVTVNVLGPDFHSVWTKTQAMTVPAGPSAKSMEMGAFTIPAGFEDKFFFIVAEAKGVDGKLLSRSVYMPRCLKMMNDAAFKAKYRGSPQPSIHLDHGPWLRPQVEGTPTKLELSLISQRKVSDDESVVKVEVRNAGAAPALETHVNIVGTERVFYGTDNDMWLAPGEGRTLEFHVQWRDAATRGAAAVTADAWNAGQKQVPVPAAR